MSVPIWNSVRFLEATVDGQQLAAGVFGLCYGQTCTSSSLGYNISTLLDAKYSGVIPGFTKSLILVPIGAGLSALAALFGLIGVFSTSRAATILMLISSLLALVVTGVAWILSMVLFGLTRNRLRDAGASAMCVLAFSLAPVKFARLTAVLFVL